MSQNLTFSQRSLRYFSKVRILFLVEEDKGGGGEGDKEGLSKSSLHIDKVKKGWKLTLMRLKA